MKKIRRYWRGLVLGVLATFVAVPALADVASDQVSFFKFVLPIVVAVGWIAWCIVLIRNHRPLAFAKVFMSGGVLFLISLFLADII